MNLTELFLHIAQLRMELDAKKRFLDHLLFSDFVTGMSVAYQIECLEPRLDELERQAQRLTREREAMGLPV